MEDGPPIFPRDFTCPAVLWIPLTNLPFRLRVSHPLRPAFPCCSTKVCCAKCGPKPRKDCSSRFSLLRFRSPLLTESISLSFPPLTEMFHFSGFRVSYPMYSGMNDRVLPRSGYPIRISPDHRLLAASRGFSQLAASFFACWHQGIHRTPLLTSSYCKSCYHFHNTTKPFRDLLYCLIAWYACLSCVL